MDEQRAQQLIEITKFWNGEREDHPVNGKNFDELQSPNADDIIAFDVGSYIDPKITKEHWMTLQEIKDENLNHSHFRAKVKPGANIRVVWKYTAGDYQHMNSENLDESEWPRDCDRGYIFTLPGVDWNDVWMSGIIHISQPNGAYKSKPEPVWRHFSDMLTNDNLYQIRFLN